MLSQGEHSFINDVFTGTVFPHWNKRTCIPLIEPTDYIARLTVKNELDGFSVVTLIRFLTSSIRCGWCNRSGGFRQISNGSCHNISP